MTIEIDKVLIKRLDNFVGGLQIRLLSKDLNLSSYEWIRKNCRVKGRPWSEENHEYQKFLIDNPSRVKVGKKCAQIGFSVITILDCLSKLGRYKGFTILYILPNAAFSQTFNATRITPLLQECEVLTEIQDKNVDSTTVKKFGTSNFLHSKGAVSKSAAISIDADYLIMDEIDFVTDRSVLTSFSSRLQHSPYKFTSKFSTPTIPKYGVDSEFNESMRHLHMAKCVHCGYQFVPKFEMIVYPGVGKGDELRTITKRDLMTHDVTMSYLECPHCHVKTDESLQHEHREWVVENPEDNFEAFGMHVQPFSLPNVRPVPQLIKEIPDFYRWVDYANNVLGETAADSENAFTEEEFKQHFSNEIPQTDSSLGYLGVDLGMVCHLTVLKHDSNDKLYCPEYMTTPLQHLSLRVNELKEKHNVRTSVFDLYPYTDTIFRIQEQDFGAWGCQFSEGKSLELFAIRMKNEDSERAIDRMQIIDAKRDRCLDAVLDLFRNSGMLLRECPDKELFIQHLCSMKRISSYNVKTGDLKFTWVKTDGVDHYFFSLMYAFLATKLRNVDPGFMMSLPFLVSTVKIKTM